MEINRKQEIEKQLSELYVRSLEKDKSAIDKLSGYLECLMLQGFNIIGFDANFKIVAEPQIVC